MVIYRPRGALPADTEIVKRRGKRKNVVLDPTYSRSMKLVQGARKLIAKTRQVNIQQAIADAMDQQGPLCFLAGTGKGKRYFYRLTN